MINLLYDALQTRLSHSLIRDRSQRHGIDIVVETARPVFLSNPGGAAPSPRCRSYGACGVCGAILYNDIAPTGLMRWLRCLDGCRSKSTITNRPRTLFPHPLP